MTEGLLLVIFFTLLVLGVPIAFSIGLATLGAMLITIDFVPASTTLAQRLAAGINSFALLAIPLFVLSGVLMGQGGIAQRLIRFARTLVGMLPGGLAFVNVIACTLFGAVSGSAVAATTAVGGVMIPAMEDDDYEREFAAALTATASTTGLLIPPSNVLIVFALASGSVSIAALFVGGYLPGLLVALCLSVVCWFYAKNRGLTGAPRTKGAEVIQAFVVALPSLALIVLVIGGIIQGAFTATEAGAVAVIYSLVLSVWVYKELSFAQLPDILVDATVTTATVMILIGTSIAMSWLLAYQNIPQQVTEALLYISDNPLIILLLINLTLLIVGSFMDMTPAVMIFTPIFLPVAVDLGMSPLHFGIMMVLNLSIGLCTPPVGSVLFISSAVADTPLTKMVRPLLPMYAAMIAALLLVTYIPEVSESLPRVFGLYP
ncbi:MAG: TRAP transporter large permease [Pseudomonadales bacterium]